MSSVFFFLATVVFFCCPFGSSSARDSCPGRTLLRQERILEVVVSPLSAFVPAAHQRQRVVDAMGWLLFGRRNAALFN